LVIAVDSGTPGRKPERVRDPLAFLENLIEVEMPRRVEEDSIKHYTYGRTDLSVRSGDSRIQRCYDNSWRCFERCRPHKETKEAERILSAFAGRPLFLEVVVNSEKKTVQRFVKFLRGNYVAVPTGGHLAVLSDVQIGDSTRPTPDKEYLVISVVMKVRWDDLNISSSRGFLPTARKPKGITKWEAHHPSTGRVCGHIHESHEDAVTCASDVGVELDGSSAGWYVRNTTEWKALGTVRMTTFAKLSASAKHCGLRVIVQPPSEHNSNGSLMILSVEWDDSRYVRWRKENQWAMPPTVAGWWRPPTRVADWTVDHRGRITGT
jgi:hypothetical protein